MTLSHIETWHKKISKLSKLRWNHFTDVCFRPQTCHRSTSGWTCLCLFVCIVGLTLQFGIHGDVREAAQHGHDLIVLLLPQETQHAASVRVLKTHQVLEAPDFILERRRQRSTDQLQETFLFLHYAQVQCVCMYTLQSYLLRDAVAEVLLLKVGQLQQWWLGLLQALHYHLGQLHAVFYGYQSRSVKTWKHTNTHTHSLPMSKIIKEVVVWVEACENFIRGDNSCLY